MEADGARVPGPGAGPTRALSCVCRHSNPPIAWPSPVAVVVQDPDVSLRQNVCCHGDFPEEHPDTALGEVRVAGHPPRMTSCHVEGSRPTDTSLMIGGRDRCPTQTSTHGRGRRGAWTEAGRCHADISRHNIVGSTARLQSESSLAPRMSHQQWNTPAPEAVCSGIGV